MFRKLFEMTLTQFFIPLPLCLHLSVFLIGFSAPSVNAEERLCPDGKRSYFGVCPEEGNNSRPLQPEVVPPTSPKPVPVTVPSAGPATKLTGSLPTPGPGLRNIAGNHHLTLHWISEYPDTGTLSINATGTPGIYSVRGSHVALDNNKNCKGCWLRVEGTIVQISLSKLWFRGSIITNVPPEAEFHGPGTCVREGEYTFEATGNRKYWRMRPWFSPCNLPGHNFGMTDYVDIFF
jgi:hypothetical protein